MVAPLTPERYKIQFTVTRETYEKLRRVQDLLRHAIPNGDPAEIFDRALTVLMDDVARANWPRPIAHGDRGRQRRARGTSPQRSSAEFGLPPPPVRTLARGYGEVTP